MDRDRRAILRSIGLSGALAAAFAAGVLKPSRLLAAEWNRAAFGARDVAAALRAAGVGEAVATDDVILKAPDVAENGAAVPIEIISGIPGTEQIAVFVDKNPFPFAARFRFSNGADAQISVRLKMAQTSNVRVIVKGMDGTFYSSMREVKVTIGGCG